MLGQNNSSSSIALVGNPGTGKSTILNGLVGSSVFSAGISYGTGRTTHLQHCSHEGRSYYDTPGLDDIDKRKEAGEELDKLLREDSSLKIIFVVVAMSGRVRSEDATTVRLVLDAIASEDTNDRFGVVINQMPQQLLDAMKNDVLIEKKVRTSITGSRHTSHWTYVLNDKELECAENGRLMTPELLTFFGNVPETRPRGADIQKVDTDSFEEKLEEEKKLFEKREEILRKEIETQSIRMNALETLTTELKNILDREQGANVVMQGMMKERQQELKSMIDAQKREVEVAKQEALAAQGNFEELKNMAEISRNLAEARAQQAREAVEKERNVNVQERNALSNRIKYLEAKKKSSCTLM